MYFFIELCYYNLIYKSMISDMNTLRKSAKQAEGLLKLLSNRNRLMILCHLQNKNLCVNELVDAIGISQSALSQHLAKMRKDKLIIGEKRGQQVFYKIAKPEIQAILSTLYLIFCHK